MKKFFTESAVLAAVCTTIVGTAGMIYSTNKSVQTKQEYIRFLRESKKLDDAREWERIEMDKYNLQLPSKFDIVDPTINSSLDPLKKPVTKHLDDMVKNSDILKHIPDIDTKFKENINSPIEKFIWSSSENQDTPHFEIISMIPTEVVNYAGLTILGCLMIILSSCITLYLNSLTILFVDDVIHKMPKALRPVYKIYKSGMDQYSKLYVCLIILSFFSLASTGVYLLLL